MYKHLIIISFNLIILQLIHLNIINFMYLLKNLVIIHLIHLYLILVMLFKENIFEKK